MKTIYCKRWFAFILLATMLVACSDSQVAVTATATNIPATASPTITPPPPTATIAPTATVIPLVWKQISDGQGFERDTVAAFATDKKDPNVIYAGMKNTGVYKTIDGGLSWQSASHGLVNMQVESLLIDSKNPLILYASTMGGVFKTEDGGGNWSKIGKGNYLLMDAQDNSHLYAHDGNGIYETKDQGNNWTGVYALNKDCPDEIHSWAIHPISGDMLFVGGGKKCAGVYQSSDGGHNWISLGMKDRPNLDRLAISMDEQGDYSVFAHFPYTSGFMWETIGWYASHDGGANWSDSNGAPCNGILTTDPETLSTLYCGDVSNLYVKKDRGNTWRAISGTESMMQTAIHIDHLNNMNRVIIGANDVSKTSEPNIGIFISEDGGISWDQRDEGLRSTQTELKIDPLDNYKIYLATYFTDGNGEGCKLYRSLDNGRNWPLIKWRGGEWCGPTFDAAHILYMKEMSSLQQSFNGGEAWLWESRQDKVGDRYFATWVHYALPSYYKEGSQSVSANPYMEGLIYDVGNVIYYSTDAGFSWQLSTNSEGSWDARLFYTEQSKMIYAIGRYHQKYSTDNGKTWQACGEDVTTSRTDSRLALDLQGTRLYLATSGNGVMVSTDNCQSWQASNEGLDNLFVNTLAIDPNDANKIYAGTDSGAYISFDGGKTWGQINDGLSVPLVVYSIVVDKDGKVYAGTPYGIYQLISK